MDLTCSVDACKTFAGNGIWCEGHRSLYQNYGTLTPLVICYHCKAEFILTVERRARNGWHTCPECAFVLSEYRHLLPKSFKAHKITSVNYLKILMAQEFRCALCPESNRLQIDHDHHCCDGPFNISCGKCIRGLLCGSCNTTVGHIEKALLSGLLTSIDGPVHVYLSTARLFV